MALYRNVAGFLEPGGNKQIGLSIHDIVYNTRNDQVDQYLPAGTYEPAQTNAPTESTTGGPYVIQPTLPSPFQTINIDQSPATEQNSLPTDIPTDAIPDTPVPTPTTSTIKQNIFPLLTLAGLVLVAVKGEDLLRNKKKIAFVAGLGALYYSMAKNSNNG